MFVSENTEFYCKCTVQINNVLLVDQPNPKVREQMTEINLKI